MYKIAVLTASDKGSQGLRTDASGKIIIDLLPSINGELVNYSVLPDDKEIISSWLIKMCDAHNVDLILTTGGTGFSPRDITPEATMSVIDRLAPGIPEAMRAKSLEITAKAMLSRAVAGIRGRTLIINLPGSPKAVSECLEVIIPVLPHAIDILKGEVGECAR